jgi:hypothetical protein
MAADPKDVLLAYLDRWMKHDVPGIVAMFAEDGKFTDPALGGKELGKHEIAAHIQVWFDAIPNMGMEIRWVGQSGPDSALAVWRLSGNATEPFGPLPAGTGEPLSLTGGDVLVINEAGEIQFTEVLLDQKSFFEQCGYQVAISA